MRPRQSNGLGLGQFYHFHHIQDYNHETDGEFMAIVLSIRGMSPSVTLLPDRKFLIGEKL